MSAPVPFSASVAARSIAGDRVRFHLGDDWQQGRTAYGGVVAALAAQAMRDVAGAGWPDGVSLRSLQCAFVSVVEPGEVEVQVERLRQGRNMTQVLARIGNPGRLGSVLIGVHGNDRPSALTPRHPARPPARAEADTLPAMPFVPRQMPPFMQHVETRASEGARPFSGRLSTHSVLHLRLRDHDAEAIEPEVLAVLLADMPATPALSELTGLAVSSSVTWSLELRPVPRSQAAGWWRIDSESVLVEGGTVNHAARLWAPDARLAAFGMQVVTVFG
ncbi:MAG: thioesterase family protein [Rubrivivax sp.]